MAICNPTCLGTGITGIALDCNAQKNIRKGGIPHLVLLACDSILIDITDDAEWAALKAAGKVIVTPAGSGTLVKPETKKEKIAACLPEVDIDEISGIDFVLKQFDNTTYTDFDFENDIKNKSSQYQLMYFGCDGILYYRFSHVSGENPGFEDISISTYRESEDGAAQKLTLEVRYNTFQVGVKGIKLTSAIKTAIGL